MKCLVLDTETTGLPLRRNASIYELENWPYIVQLSFITYDTSKNMIVDKYDTIIKLGDNVEITPKSISMHNITKEKSQTYGVDIKEGLSRLNNAILECDVIVGHNISFDKQILIVENIRSSVQSAFPQKNVHCTMIKNKALCNVKTRRNNGKEYVKYPTLTELHQRLFESTPKNLHNSLSDVIICLRCYIMANFNVDPLVVSESFFEVYFEHFRCSLDLVSIYS